MLGSDASEVPRNHNKVLACCGLRLKVLELILCVVGKDLEQFTVLCRYTIFFFNISSHALIHGYFQV